jgi:hypothetical protein
MDADGRIWSIGQGNPGHQTVTWSTVAVPITAPPSASLLFIPSVLGDMPTIISWKMAVIITVAPLHEKVWVNEGIAPLFLTSAIDGSWHLHAPSALTLGK